MPNTLAQQRIVDPVLTTIAQGYQQADLVAHRLLPNIPHDKEGGKIPRYDKSAFKEYNTTRAIRTNSVRVDLGHDSIPFVMEEESIEVPTDEREREDSALDTDEVATKTAQGIINLTHERKVASLVTATASYGAGSYVNVAADDRWSNYPSATSLPVVAIDDAKEVIRGKVGRYPNVLVIGPKVFKALKSHPTIIDRIKYSQKGVITEELLATIFDVDEVWVGKAIKSSDAGTMSDVWGNDAVLAVVPKDNKGLGVPAFGYTLHKKGRPLVETYFDPGAKSKIVVASDIFAAVITASEAGYLFKGAVA
ncbi:MAG: major capsid protein [Myxococcales bacterium]|nr:major capsid protein [Myxococcales bacterium]